MRVGRAVGIASDITSERFSDKEKAEALYVVISHDRFNEMKKDAMAEVIKWLFRRCFRVRENRTGKEL